MKEVHIPDVMATGMFTNYKMMHILGMDEGEGITYAIHYECKSRQNLEQYQNQYAPRLQKEHIDKYKDKFVAFRTLMEVV